MKPRINGHSIYHMLMYSHAKTARWDETNLKDQNLNQLLRSQYINLLHKR